MIKKLAVQLRPSVIEDCTDMGPLTLVPLVLLEPMAGSWATSLSVTGCPVAVDEYFKVMD